MKLCIFKGAVFGQSREVTAEKSHHVDVFVAMEKKKEVKDYWKRNLILLAILLVIWFAVSFLFGIILVEPLNTIRLGGFKLGFWFAQQGSIYTFILLIFVYVIRMNKLDKEFEVDED